MAKKMPMDRRLTFSERRIVESIKRMLLDIGVPKSFITRQRLLELLELYCETIDGRAVVFGNPSVGRVIIPRRLE